MDKKKLQEDIKYIKNLLNSKENELEKMGKEENNNYYCCGCCDCDESESELKNITVDISVDCGDDKNLEDFILQYISEEIQELVEEAVELYSDEDFNEDDECESELKFELIGDKEGNAVGVVMMGYCPECEEEHILQIFSNGDKDVEEMAKDMGFRD